MRSARDRRKSDRTHTPLGIDQLEARMLCAVDTLSDLLATLHASPGRPTSNAAQVAQNKAPTIARPISLSTPQTAIVRSVNLSVLGRDDRPESSLVYRWTVTPLTQDASATFSSNASNASKNTTLTFTRSGAYEVRVTITDAGKLSASNTLRINVSPVLTSIVVTPGTSSIAAGRTQQLTARGLDQFQQPLARQPAITWSANAGSVSQSGLFAAPNAATSATVTARSGNIAATARINVAAPVPTPLPTPAPTPAPTPVNPGPGTGLSNAALNNLVSTYFADGSINRADMIQLLRSAGNDGLVDASELNDFRFIVSNATRYNIPGYVQVLASNIVNNNPANNFYQGQTSSNLTAGSSFTLLNNLVEKWFFGSDVPTLTSSSLSYQVVAGSLFNGTPSRSNMKQGALGDCYFIASLGSVADSNPTAVSNMFIDNSDGTYTVRFYTGTYGAFYNTDGSISDGFRSGTGVADYITVNRRLPAYSNGTLAYSGNGSRVNDASNTLWIALAEKAYVQWNATGKSGRDGTNSYASIEGGWMGVVNAQVLGYNSTSYHLDSRGQSALIAALASKNAVTIGTKAGANAGGLVGGHAYTVTGYNPSTQTFSLANPWGTSHPTPLTWAQLQSNCSMFVTANPVSSTPILASGAAPSVRGATDAASHGFLHLSAPVQLDDSPKQISSSSDGLSSIDTPTLFDFATTDPAIRFELTTFLHLDKVAVQTTPSGSADAIDQVLSQMIDSILSLDDLEQCLA